MKPQLVMICGTARAGKDSLAEALMWQMWLRKHNSHTVRLGDLVRQELARATGVPVEEQLLNRGGWRKVWQWWGTEVRRQLCGDDYWVNQWCSHADLRPDGDSLLVPDVRFPNELLALSEYASMRGLCPRVVIVRRSHLWELRQMARRSRWHASETEWRPVVWEYAPDLIRNTGTLDELSNEAQKLVQKWNAN